MAQFWKYCHDQEENTNYHLLLSALFSHRDAALPPQQRFTNSPPLFVHTEPSSFGVKPHQWPRCQFVQKTGAAAPKEA